MSRKNKISETVCSIFSPDHFEVINESDQHSGPPGRESHFKLIIVSDKFDGKSRVSRHQWVYGLFNDDFKNGLHALSLKLYTPEEWKAYASQSNLQSPKCASKKSLT